MIRAIIVEDETIVRNGFIKLLKTFCPQVDIVGEADSVVNGQSIIANTEFDILFLDINLSDGSGFDLIHQVRKRSFHTIFVTAYDQYAIDAFKVGALDYLLKPVSPDSLVNAIERVENSASISLDTKGLAIAKKFLDKEYNQSEKIIIKDLTNMYVIKISDILYCSASGAYSTFHIENRESIITSLNLKEYERILEPYGFIRCHNSHLANMQHILQIKKTGGGSIIMSNQSILPLSTRRKTQVFELLKNNFLS